MTHNFHKPPLFISLATSAPLSTLSSSTNKTAFISSIGGVILQNSSDTPVITSTTRLTPAAAASALRNHSTEHNNSTSDSAKMKIDKEYPGTAVQRMLAVRERVSQLSSQELNGPWKDVRRSLLWAGGLKDLPDAVPGQGYTGHSFNDYNHVDLTCMTDGVSHNENDGENVVRGIAKGNRLGAGITLASISELGPGGSWTTCANGCNLSPPQDVAHVQFQSRIAFKLVWIPNGGSYDNFVLVDDDGKLLARGAPTGKLPQMRQRQMNYALVNGSKYATAANDIDRGVATE